MGKVANFFIGLFVMGAGVLSQGLTAFAPDAEGMPYEPEAIIELVSTGLLGFGGLIVGYTLLSVILGLLWHNIKQARKAKKRRQQEKQRRQHPQQQTANQPRQGQRQRRDQHSRQRQNQQRQRNEDRHPVQQNEYEPDRKTGAPLEQRQEIDTTNPEELPVKDKENRER